jgi:hypothetical protein
MSRPMRSVPLAGKTPIARKHDGLRARAHPDLAEDGGQVIAHRLLADEQLGGDLLIVGPAGYPIQDLALPSRQ